jgi:hypothetical protein
MRQARTSGRRRAEVGQLARAAVRSSKFRAHSYKFETVLRTQNCAQVLWKLKISVRLYLSPSHRQSLGAQLWYLGDGQQIRTRTRVLLVRKAISSIFLDLLELKLFLCWCTKKIGLCWKSAAADLCNGRWMGSACDPGLEAVCFKARGSNYVVLN